MHTMVYDSGIYLFLWSGKSNLNCSCLCIHASQMITLLWFCKIYVSTVYLLEYFKISDIGQTENW